MKLYSFFNSSTSYRVRIALELKSLNYVYHGVNIRLGEETTIDYVSMAPGKGVPLLIDDNGRQLSQSLAIVCYLDDIQPDVPLIPLDIELKASVLEFYSVIACDIHPVNNLKILHYLQDELGVSGDEKNAWYRHWMAEGLSAAEALLARQPETPFCFGEQPTLADVALIPQIANALRTDCDLSPYPRLMAVFKHCQTLPAFMAAAPSKQPDYAI